VRGDAQSDYIFSFLFFGSERFFFFLPLCFQKIRDWRRFSPPPSSFPRGFAEVAAGFFPWTLTFSFLRGGMREKGIIFSPLLSTFLLREDLMSSCDFFPLFSYFTFSPFPTVRVKVS